ncbi:MAG: hypothetical protein HQM12_17715 [SAR324 cluster bacterium]|nr:hypothetical protein [SAR324 cluster bacterium]
MNNHQEWNLSEDIQQKIICGSSQAYINALETSAQWQGVDVTNILSSILGKIEHSAKFEKKKTKPLKKPMIVHDPILN